MRYVDELRDAERGACLSQQEAATVVPTRQYEILEACGGHAHTIYRRGVRDLRPRIH